MGDMDDFLAREKALREKTAALAAATGQVATMRAHGTRKRRRKGKEEKDKRKRRRRAEEDGAGEDDDEGGGEAGLEGEKDAEKERDGSESETSELDVFGSPKGGTPVASPPPDTDTATKPKPKPRPRPRAKVAKSSPEPDAPSISGPAAAPTTHVSGSQHSSQVPSDGELSSTEALRGVGRKKTARLVFSDEEDE